jgi:alpha-galactosidase/6-phospho-beta-glucosidase family protein
MPANLAKEYSIAEASRMIGALASPYLQYYFFEHQIIEGQDNQALRATVVASVNRKMRSIMLSGKADIYDELLQARGGYALGAAVGRFLGSYFGVNPPVVMNLCSRANHLNFPLSKMLIAPEMPMRVSAGSIRSIVRQSSDAAGLLSLISPIASAEENLMLAAIDRDRAKLEKAMLVHPLVRQLDRVRELAKYIESSDIGGRAGSEP